MPGVITRREVRSGPLANPPAPSATMFLSGLTERGPAGVAVLIESYAEFLDLFGARVSYGLAHDQIRAYFEESKRNGQVYFTRVVGAAADSGTLELLDTLGDPTASIDANGEGAWSADLEATVAAGTVTDTKKVTITFGTRSEVYDNIETIEQLIRNINDRSSWVTATNLGSTNDAPDNLPVNLVATALSEGDDDRLTLDADDYTAACDAAFGPELGAGVICVPGFTSAQIGDALLAHCGANRRITYLATAAGAEVEDAIAASQDLRGTEFSERGGLLYPHILVDDDANGVRTISPEGFIAGKRALAHTIIGSWRIPGGEPFAVSSDYVKGVERVLTAAEGNALDDAEVCAIRVLGNAVQLYGYRSLSADEINWKWLYYADEANHIEVEGGKKIAWAVLEPIDAAGGLFGNIETSLRGLMEPIKKGGGVYPRNGDDGYTIDVGPNINTIDTIAAGEIGAIIAFRPPSAANLIVLTVVKSTLTATV